MLRNGGPAFPGITVNDSDVNLVDPFGTLLPPNAQATYSGMSLRDYFALNLPADEIRDVAYHSLSREAQEKLTGMKCPVEPAMNHGGGLPADYFIEKAKFQAAVNAALRFMAADAMLAARGE